MRLFLHVFCSKYTPYITFMIQKTEAISKRYCPNNERDFKNSPFQNISKFFIKRKKYIQEDYSKSSGPKMFIKRICLEKFREERLSQEVSSLIRLLAASMFLY